jgi:hypothetical protein
MRACMLDCSLKGFGRNYDDVDYTEKYLWYLYISLRGADEWANLCGWVIILSVGT